MMTPEKLFKELTTIYPDISLGGSLMLNQLGLLSRPAKDLDINVPKDSRFIQTAQFFTRISPCKTLVYDYGKNDNHFRFNLGGVDVCVFVKEDNKSNLQYALEAKIKYGLKDTPSGRKHASDLREIKHNLYNKPLLYQTLMLAGHLPMDYKISDIPYVAQEHIEFDLPF
jgi:hypothetical protein